LGGNGSSARSRQRSRELLVQALYQWQLAGHERSELVAQFRAQPEFARIDQPYFHDLLERVIAEAPALEELIAEHATRGSDQLDAVGRAVLLLALAELRYRPDVPTRVIINEAVELTKRFGAAESFKFVNAVLDRASRREDVRGSAQ
jgi:transcription antitermination protein NusB